MKMKLIISSKIAFMIEKKKCKIISNIKMS